MTPLQTEQYWLGLQRLREKAFLWPEPHDLLIEGAKLLTYETIRASAAVLGEPYPNIVIEPEPSEELVVEIQTGAKRCVLKRDFSDCGEHVFHPDMPNAVEIFQNAWTREGNVHRNGQPTMFPRPIWFLQPYLPGFVLLGEIRAFFVNGTLYNSFVTTPTSMNAGLLGLEVGPLVVARPSNLFK